MEYRLIKHQFFAVLLVFLVQCADTRDPVTGEKERIEPNINQRAKDYVEKSGGGLMGVLGKSNENTNFKFSTSNVLWRATLKSLDFLPLVNVDYAGGVIIYDWYSQTNNPREQIKISVQFLSDEIRGQMLLRLLHTKKFAIVQNGAQIHLLNKTLLTL